MNAIVCTKYGPPEVLELREVEKPTPKKNEVRIRNIATTVTASDAIVRGFKLRRWSPLGIMMALVVGIRAPRKPILGMVVAGDIESLGEEVSRFKLGDQVYGSTLNSAVAIRFGAYAEYICLPENSLITHKPPNLTYEEAAAIPYGGGLAIFFVKKADIQPGQKVLIYGASGAIGTMAVQFVKASGANVTGICSTRNLEFVESLGADHVIDYTRQDSLESGQEYDWVFDAVGHSKTSALKKQSKEALTPNGKYASVDEGSPSNTIEDFHYFNELIKGGKLQPVIDRSYPLEEMVEAHRYVDKGHKRGNVVITIADSDAPDAAGRM